MIKRNNHCPILIFLIAGLIFTGGCKKKVETPQTPPSPQHQPVAKAPAPVQTQQSSAKSSLNATPSLDFTNRKDPFKPFIVPQAQAAKPLTASDTGKDLLPIQSFELSKFKIAGIIVGLKENRALVIDPAGKGYVVKQGMLIGSNDGRISRITATTIEVVESYKENGRIRKRTSKLTLPQKK